MSSSGGEQHRGGTVSIGTVAGVVSLCLAHGLRLTDVVDASGLDLAELMVSDGRLPEELLTPIWHLLAVELPDEPVGLDLALETPLSVLGPLIHVSAHLPDLRAALRAFVRFAPVLSSWLEPTLEEAGGGAMLRFCHPLDGHDGGRSAELYLGLGHRFLSEVLGAHDQLGRVSFAHPSVGSTARYAEHFGVPVRFEQPRTALFFSSRALDTRLTRVEPGVFQFIRRHIDEALRRPDDEDAAPAARRIHEGVRAAALRGEFGAEALASELGTGLRTLQRRAREHGLELRTLQEDARLACARALLSERRLRVDEIAFLLGYPDEGAFRRACGRWSGLSLDARAAADLYSRMRSS